MGGTLLYGACGAFAAGVAVALLTPVPFLFVLICLALGGASFFFRSRTRHAVPLAVALIAFSCGAGRAHITLTNLASETLPQYIGAKVAIAGRVVGDPDVREASARVVLGDLSIDNELVSGKLLVSLPPSAEVAYSDQLYVQGNVQAPQTFETQAGRIFDYPNYLRAQGVQAQMSYAKLLATKQSGLSLQSFLFSLKHTFERSLDALLPDPDNALLQGVLLGEKRGISQELTQAFMLSGLVHIVVLSGYNISVVAEAVFRTLGFLPRTLRFGLGGVLMLLFALMTGAGAATVRALIMALVALLARFARRPHLALRALVVAAGAMIFWNPLVLFYDSSFILSILATFGLITLSPWVEQLMVRKLPKRVLKTLGEEVRSILASTIAVELYVIPALLYFSGVLSLLSLPANALVLPVIPATMLFGFFAGLLGLLHPLLGLLPAFVADILLKWVLLVVATVAAIPLSSITLPQLSAWLIALTYIPLTWFAVKQYQTTRASSSRAQQSAFR